MDPGGLSERRPDTAGQQPSVTAVTVRPNAQSIIWSIPGKLQVKQLGFEVPTTRTMSSRSGPEPRRRGSFARPVQGNSGWNDISGQKFHCKV